jgi:hypothetical protein
MLKHCPNIQGYHYCDCKDDCQIRKELNMAQQTAVEWFYQRILAEDIKAVFEQAKAMEKEQILNACYQFSDYPFNKEDHLEYYNETYNK